MSPDIVLVIALVAFFALVVYEAPIALALIASGVLGIVLLDGWNVAGEVLAAVPYSSTASYGLFAIPMFVLLGAVVSNAGITRQIFAAAGALVRRVPGGLAATTVGATALLSGISGSSAADVATMGRVCIGEMRREGYSPAYAAAVVAAAGAFAALIPPAIGLILYAIIAGVSVGDMLLAGVIPGLISAAILGGFVLLRARSGGPEIAGESRAPSAHNDGAVDLVASVSVRQRVQGVLYALVLFGIVVGGIYAGVFTATEAGAVGAFAAVVLTVLTSRRQRGPLTKVLGTSLRETISVTSMIFLLLVGGSLFTYLVVSTNLPSRLTSSIAELPLPPLMIVAMFLLVLLPLGMFLDGLSIMLLTLPIVAPVVLALGYDSIWFGILFMKMMEIGLITPPVGINCYILAGLDDQMEVEDVFRRVLPFVALDLGVTAIFFAFPGIVTWLPELAG